MSFFKEMMSDESGAPSWFRFAASGALIFSGWFTVKAVGGTEIPEWVASYWLPVTLTLLAGAGGPKMVMYLAQMGAAIVQRLRGMAASSYTRTEVEERVDVEPSEMEGPGGKVG